MSVVKRVMNGATMLLGVMSGGIRMLIRADLAAMGLVVTVVPVMGCSTPLAAHRWPGTAADVAAALVALVSFAQDFLVALGLIDAATELEVLVVRLVVNWMVLGGRIVRNCTTLGVTPVMEALMTFHCRLSFKSLVTRALRQRGQLPSRYRRGLPTAKAAF